jgi:hypothetical protein
MVLRGLCDIQACGLLLELIHGKIQTTLTRYKLSRQVFCSLFSAATAALRARDSSAHTKRRDKQQLKIYISIEQLRLSRSAQNEPGLELEFLTAVVIFAVHCADLTRVQF